MSDKEGCPVTLLECKMRAYDTSGGPLDPYDRLLMQWLVETVESYEKAVKKHYSQHADDMCYHDDDELYRAFGLPPKDKSVGDKFAMLKNCIRFIERRCTEGGKWKSYAELEEENKRLRDIVEEYRGLFNEDEANNTEPKGLGLWFECSWRTIQELDEKAAKALGEIV